jgi:glycosyltransferase involved in cell wall biosynthesis
MLEQRSTVDLSVIVPVGRRQADAASLYAEYKAGLDALGQTYEIIFVLDGPQPQFDGALRDLLARGERFTIVGLSRSFGDATAVMAGFEHSSGQMIVTLPAYHQIQPSELARLVDAAGASTLATGMRWPRAGSPFERARRSAYHRLLRTVTNLDFHDLGCTARAFDRRILEEIPLYGDQYRFMALLADRQGFRVREVEVRQSPKDRHPGGYSAREYARALIDILSIFFLVRFTKKPLRFFGMLGATTFFVGALLITWLVVDRLFFAHGLAERPALLLSSLLVVLGFQLFALGLLGELVIFTHAKQLNDYYIDSVVRFKPTSAQAGESTASFQKIDSQRQ